MTTTDARTRELLRRLELDVTRRLRVWGKANAGDIPFVMLLNKSDLTSDWALQDDDLRGDNRPGCRVIATSAKTGEGVEEAFRILAEKMIVPAR